MKRWVTLVGYLEGFSFLILMFYAMPLKYIAGEPEMVTLFGSLHGGLFVAYVGLLPVSYTHLTLPTKVRV